MNNCNLCQTQFNERQSGLACSVILIIVCSFLNCHSTTEGGALYVSTKGSIHIGRTVFRNCSTTTVAGASSCKVVELSMTSTCYFNCFGRTSGNVYHATGIFGAQSQSSFEVTQCGFAFCPREIKNSDQTIAIWYKCVTTFKDNNFTENNLGQDEMISFYSDSYVKDALMYCNLNKCVSGHLIHNWLVTSIEKINIIGNSPGIGDKQIIYDNGATTLADCIIAHNTHTSLSHYSKTTVISCFFCNNSFKYSGEELCVPTHKLLLLDAQSCKRGSYLFTKIKELQIFSVLYIHAML